MSGKEYTVVEEVDLSQPFSDQYGKGFYVKETWYQGPIIHRRFGPAITLRHPSTLIPIREEFIQEGQIHRYGGPAVIDRDPHTGEVTSERYFEHGREVDLRSRFPQNDIG